MLNIVDDPAKGAATVAAPVERSRALIARTRSRIASTPRLAFNALVLLLGLLGLMPAAASSETHFVDPNDATCGGDFPCYSTLQAAVDAAMPGDTVRALQGTHSRQVKVKGKNSGAAASEVDRIIIEADPAAPRGSVLLEAGTSECAHGWAIRVVDSRS